jgi:hypothetical protein
MKTILPMDLKIPLYSRSFESTYFLASHDMDVISPEFAVLNVLWIWGLLKCVNLYAK